MIILVQHFTYVAAFTYPHTNSYFELFSCCYFHRWVTIRHFTWSSLWNVGKHRHVGKYKRWIQISELVLQLRRKHHKQRNVKNTGFILISGPRWLEPIKARKVSYGRLAMSSERKQEIVWQETLKAHLQWPTSFRNAASLKGFITSS